MFGPVERAVVCTDERGRSLGYGIVDFYRKSHAQQAISRCRDDFFVLTRSVCGYFDRMFLYEAGIHVYKNLCLEPAYGLFTDKSLKRYYL